MIIQHIAVISYSETYKSSKEMQYLEFNKLNFNLTFKSFSIKKINPPAQLIEENIRKSNCQKVWATYKTVTLPIDH